MARHKSRLSHLLALGDDPAVRELASCAESAGRLARKVQRWLAAHPAGHRCRVCAELRRAADARDELAGLAAVLVAMRGLVDCSRPRTAGEWRRVCSVK